MTSIKKRILAICFASAALAACGNSNNSATPPVVVTPPAAKLEDQFGANFGTAYRADPNSVAKDPAPGDIIPVDPTKDAVTI